MKVDDGVEEGEDFGGKLGHILHGPVVRVEDGERPEHPHGMDTRPGHKGEVIHLLRKAMMQLIKPLRKNTKRPGDSEYSKRLSRESNSQSAHPSILKAVFLESQTRTQVHSQTKHQPTPRRTQHHLHRSIAPSRQLKQITRKRDPRQQIRKKHKHRAREHKLVKRPPIAPQVSPRKSSICEIQIGAQEAEGAEGAVRGEEGGVFGEEGEGEGGVGVGV